jgi:hypothetical protein
LTGPNGTGKSTVLYALAAVISGSRNELGHDLLAPRMRSPNVMAALETDDGQVSAVTHDELPHGVGVPLPGPLGGPEIGPADSGDLRAYRGPRSGPSLKAKEAGNHDRAELLADSIRHIASVVAQIVDDQDFGFVISDQDDQVRVRWKGVVVRLGVLPDGLKSIVSWVADLLMRLDRIPWHGATPILQRRFLLLLDEVDIHLHPAWQRKILPFVQRIFPSAQIIASTHSPFVVASVDDARIITLGLRGQASVVEAVTSPQIGVSYPAVLRSIFGIASEFDIDTDERLQRFHAAVRRRLLGDLAAQAEIDELGAQLAQRSEELREIVALELAQFRRQLKLRAAP